MSNLNVTCPQCQSSFELTEALAEPMLRAARETANVEMLNRIEQERAAIESAVADRVRVEEGIKILDLEIQIEGQRADIKKAREAEMAALKAQEAAEEARRNVEIEVARRVHAETAAAAERLRGQVTQEFALKFSAYDAQVTELLEAAAAKDVELDTARQAEVAARKAKQEADDAKRNLELEVARRVASASTVIAESARAQTGLEFEAKLRAAEVRLADIDKQRRAAEEAELAARKAVSDAEDALRQAGLLAERTLAEERAKVREQAVRERDEENRLKLAEKDKQLADLNEQVAALKRSTEQGSQQLAGEVQEVDLLDMLSDAFPGDRFERTGKGQRGADVRHTVMGPGGIAGIILWEAKRTKLWSDGWLPKLRADQRDAKADVAVLASETLPDAVLHFECVDGVWVTAFRFVVPLAEALRQRLIEAARARRAAAGADQKKDLTYDYVTGNEFRRRVAGMLEPLVEMRNSLDSEKRSADRLFAARAKQIDRLGTGLAGVYGDFQGILGSSLPTVDGFALPEPDATVSVDEARLTDGSVVGTEVH